MITKHEKRRYRKLGYSLSELLVTVLIMSMVTAAVAGASSAVLRVYRSVTLRADAQTLLSTAASAIAKDLYTAEGDVTKTGEAHHFSCEDIGGTVDYTNQQNTIMRTTSSGLSQPLVADPTRTHGLTLELDDFHATEDSDTGVWVFQYTLTVSKEGFSQTQDYAVRSMISKGSGVTQESARGE